MTPNKPYLIRALYEWITDNNCTPYLLVNALMPDCQIPEEHVKDGRIVFNITMDVVHDLVLGNEAIEFTARFSGKRTHIYIPIAAVLAIFAKENQEGMAFPEEIPPKSRKKTSPDIPKVKGKPNLKIVK